MGKGSIDEKMVIYGSGLFSTRVVQTRDYCACAGLRFSAVIYTAWLTELYNT